MSCESPLGRRTLREEWTTTGKAGPVSMRRPLVCPSAEQWLATGGLQGEQRRVRQADGVVGQGGVAKRRGLLLPGGRDPVEELAEHDAHVGRCLLLVEEGPTEVGEGVGAAAGAVDDVE